MILSPILWMTASRRLFSSSAMATSCFWFSRLRCFWRFSSMSSSFSRRSTSTSSCSRRTKPFNSPFRSTASSAAIRYLGSSSSAICRWDSRDSTLGSVSLYSERMTLNSRYSRGVDLLGGDCLISWVRRSMWAMMTLLSARRLRFCSFTSAFSCLQCRNYQFYASSRCRNRPYSYSTRPRRPRASSSRFSAIPYHRCAAYNSFLTLPRSLSRTAMVRSDSDSRMAFFSSRASRNLVMCLMNRTASSLSQEGGASRGGVERRESPIVLPGLPRARLPIIFPSERLRFALQTEIYWSISPSLRRLRQVIAKFYFDNRAHFYCHGWGSE